MFLVKIFKKIGPSKKDWERIFSGFADESRSPNHKQLTLNEADKLSIQVYLPPGNEWLDARLRIGDLLVCSTLPQDRTNKTFELKEYHGQEYLLCVDHFLSDWVGLTELTIELCLHQRWHRIFTLPLAVQSNKVRPEEFDVLFEELAQECASILFDIYGKTRVGLNRSVQLGSLSPLASWNRLQSIVLELTSLMQQLARQPASKLRAEIYREPSLIGESVSELTLAEACRDPRLLIRVGNKIEFGEQIREFARPDYQIPEHQFIADFLAFLGYQISDLRKQILEEILERSERKKYRNHRIHEDASSWWETEDLPRIQKLESLRNEAAKLSAQIDQLRQLPFLPEARKMIQVPPSTSLFRNHRCYRSIYRIMAEHFYVYQMKFDRAELLTRIRSLPVLYEYWCAVRVIKFFQKRFTIGGNQTDRSSPLQRLSHDRSQFVIDFAQDQELEFRDEFGYRIVLRFQPIYRATDDHEGYGLLDLHSTRNPDLTIELFPVIQGEPSKIPELIIVLDAKYSSRTHRHKMEELTTKYSKIGIFRTGKILSRQIWALMPMRAEKWSQEFNDPLRSFCTVDNSGFWSDSFDMQSTTCGAIEARPQKEGDIAPLEMLLERLLRNSGVSIRSAASLPLGAKK